MPATVKEALAVAVRSFVDMKRDVIAIFKCLGAAGDLVFLIYGLQVLFVTVIGVVVGLAGGVGLTEIAATFLKDLLPIDAANPVYPTELADRVAQARSVMGRPDAVTGVTDII